MTIPAIYDFEILKEELDAYNKAKHEVFDVVFELEEKIVTKDREGIQQLFADKTGKLLAGKPAR